MFAGAAMVSHDSLEGDIWARDLTGFLSPYLWQTKHYTFNRLMQLSGHLKMLSSEETLNEPTHVEPDR